MTSWLLAIWLAAITPTSPEPGARLFRQCASCHALEAGAHTPAGPSLFGILNRPIAGQTGFNYSPAMRRFGQRERVWTRERLDLFLSDPEGVVPGTEMGFPGIPDPAERRALIDWLGNRSSD